MASETEYIRADRIEALDRELAEGKRRNAELDREITGLRNSYWEERKAHLAAEAREARLSEAADFLCDRLDEFDRDINDNADSTAYHGHVAPAKSRLRAALSGSNSAPWVPDGWKLVPVEPKPEMLAAWYRYKSGHRFPDEPPATDTSDYGAYRAMLSAAPQPTGGE